MLKTIIIRAGEADEDVDVLLRIKKKMLVFANVCSFFDPLLFKIPFAYMLLLIGALAKFGKASDDQVPDLLIVRIARYQEHIPGDSLLQHLIARDSIVAQGQEDPGDVCLDDDIDFTRSIVFAKGVEQVKHSFRNQNVNRLLAQSKMYQSQSAILSDLNLLTLVSTKIHDEINDSLLDDLVE